MIKSYKKKELSIQMKSKSNDVVYTGKRRFQDLETGEIIEIDEIIKKVSRQGFMLTYLSAIVDLIDSLGNKKMQVVKYILNHMDRTQNTLIITTTELAKKSKTSYQTTQNTLKTLENAGIITRRTGALMVHSNLIHRGNAQREAYLLTKFQAFNERDNEEEKVIDVTPKRPELPPPLEKSKDKEQPPKPDLIKDQISLIEEKRCPYCNEKLKLKKDKTKYYCPNLYAKKPQEKCKGFFEINENKTDES